jgi:hypothetical protein
VQALREVAEEEGGAVTMTNERRMRLAAKLLALFKDERTPSAERENAHRRLVEMIKTDAARIAAMFCQVLE